jgi:APA family basic amino acid/polyamine antiporter
MADKHQGAAGELLRILGIGFGLAVVIGGIVGQGIMRTPGIVAGALPSEAWVLGAWALGGLLILVDACATVELGASVPRSGGPYVFAARAFGPTAGAMVGWADALSYTFGMSYVSVVFAEYAQRLGIGTMLPTGALAVLLIAVLGAINWTGTKTSGRSQIVGTALKGIGLTLLVLALWLTPARGAALSSAPHALAPVVTVAAIGTAMRAVAVTYGGWNAAVYCSEEMCQPERNIVRVTFGGILLVLVLYLTVNGALFHALSREQIAASNLPVADAAAAALGPVSGKVITILAILSVVAICNLMVMFVSRIVFAMARNGILPAFLTRVPKSGTPRMALLCTTAIAAFLASSGSYERLIALGAPFLIGVPAVTDIAAIAMRIREPDLERPFRMPLFPLPALVGFVVNALIVGAIVYEDPFDSLVGFALLLVVGAITKVHAHLTLRPVAA